MTVKVTMANGGSDSVDFINNAGTTLAQVKGYDDGSSNGHLELYTTASGTASEKVRVDKDGNVGIGTSSPSNFAGYTTVDIRNATTGGVLQLGSTASAAGYIFGDVNLLSIESFSTRPIVFSTNGSQRMRIDSSGIVTGTAGNLMLVSGTAVASTSGTSISFTGIPSWAKKITVLFSGVSTNGTSPMQIQIGSSSFTTTGYIGSATGGGGAIATTNNSTGFLVSYVNVAATLYSGIATVATLGSNVWVESGTLGGSSTGVMNTSGGSLTLGGVLDRIRITTVNGTDTFDAGSINILYE